MADSSDNHPPASPQAAPWPHFDDEQVTAVERILRSGKVNYWTGPEGRAFEADYATHTGRRHAIALANGTLALELALKALDIGPGDHVIVPPRTFIGTATSVIVTGATPVFADVDRDSGNLTAATIDAAMTDRTRAVIPVHLAGWPCDMPAIMALAKTAGVHVIEDCAQAHGATVDGIPVGGLGDLGAFSFCQDKIITTGGEGGMLVLDDEAIWNRAWSYKDHGRSFDAVYHREHPPGFRYLIESFGTNWRLTEMQSAIGRIQLRRLGDWVAARTRNAQAIAACLAQFSCVRVPMPEARMRHAFYKLYAYVRPERLARGWSRDRIMAEFDAGGVPGLSGACSEIYLEKAFDGTDYRPDKRLPVARELGKTSLMFMVHPTLTKAHVDNTCRVLQSVLSRASN